jgi:hypothetical protein
MLELVINLTKGEKLKSRKNFIPFSKGKFKRQHIAVSDIGDIGDISETEFDNIFNDDTSDQWEEKARKLQVRRWRRIKHQLI